MAFDSDDEAEDSMPKEKLGERETIDSPVLWEVLRHKIGLPAGDKRFRTKYVCDVEGVLDAGIVYGSNYDISKEDTTANRDKVVKFFNYKDKDGKWYLDSKSFRWRDLAVKRSVEGEW